MDLAGQLPQAFGRELLVRDDGGEAGVPLARRNVKRGQIGDVMMPPGLWVEMTADDLAPAVDDRADGINDREDGNAGGPKGSKRRALPGGFGLVRVEQPLADGRRATCSARAEREFATRGGGKGRAAKGLSG